MKYVARRPDFEVTVFRPNYDQPGYQGTKIVSFISGLPPPRNTKSSDALVSYSFEESLHTPDSSFHLRLTLEADEQGRTWYNKIQLMDLVFISEFGEIRYTGFVQNRRIAQSMGDKPRRYIIISGSSIGAMLTNFPLVLDQFLYEGTTTAKAASRKLSARLAALQDTTNVSVAEILIAIYESYFELTQAVGTLGASQGIRGVIDHFMDVESRLSSNVVVRYPMSFSMYQVGVNNIWEIISQVITPPVNELFGLWNPKTNKYEVVFRQAPFEEKDWRSLPITPLPTVAIREADLGNSDSEVFTFYLATLPGSGISRRKAMVYDSGLGKIPQIDTEKWKKYGYRPMLVDFRYFNRDHEKTFSAGPLMTVLSEMMKKWFERNDEFLSGSVTFMTMPISSRRKKTQSPRIGERLSFLEGEFYIEKSEHSWEMEGPMETKLGLTRGYVYYADGSFREPIEIGRLKGSANVSYEDIA